MNLKESFKVREFRDKLLRETNKFTYCDIWEDLTRSQKDEIKSYRSELRNITVSKQFYESENFYEIKWPTQPSWMSSVSNAIENDPLLELNVEIE